MFWGEWDGKHFNFLENLKEKQRNSVAELKNIGGDLMLMIKNIDFTNVHNKFQEKLNSDITEIRNSSIVIVPADKKCNLYKIERL